MTDLASLVVRMQADNSQYIKALQQATDKLNKHAKDSESAFNRIGEQVTDIAKKVAAAFTIEKLVEFTAGAIEAADALDKLSEASGVSASTLGAMNIALAGSGVSLEDLGTSFKKLNVAASEAAGDATTKAGVAFRLLGVNVKDANGNIKDAQSLSLEVADAFANTANGANKVAIAVALYGKAGERMIPLLNQGSAALKEQQAAAVAAGAVFSDDLAKSAGEVNDAFARMAATVKGQLQVAIATQLVPAMQDALAAFNKLSANGEALQAFGSIVAAVFKGIVSLAIEVKSEVDNVFQVFSGIGAYAAAAAQAAQGNFSQAKSIISDYNARTEKIASDAAAAQTRLWQGAAADQAAAAETGSKATVDAAEKTKEQLKSIEGQMKQDAADKALEKFAQGLQVQAQAFGLGAVASAKYKLSVGELADELKIASDKGKAAAASAIAFVQSYQNKVDTKAVTEFNRGLQETVDKFDQSDVAAFKYKVTTGELGDQFDRLGTKGEKLRQEAIALNNAIVDQKNADAVQKLSDQMEQLDGHLTSAAVHAFDLQNRGLQNNLNARGDTAGQEVLANARKKVEYENQYQELVVAGEKIQLEYTSAIADIQLKLAQGKLTDSQALALQNDALNTQIGQLNQIYAQEKQIADVAGIDKLKQQTQDFANSIKSLQAQIDPMTTKIREDLENDLQDPLYKVETGAESAKSAFSDFIKSVQKDLLSIANKDIAQMLFGSNGVAGGAPGFLAGLFGGGGGGGNAGGGYGSLLSTLGGLFGGGSSAGTSSLGGAAAALDSQGIGGDTTSALLSALAGFAGGGTIGPKGFAIVGERGPEVAYAGSKDLHIQPMSSGRGGVSVSPTFVLSAPGGTITRQSQTQAASEIGRQVSIATRRNG